MLETANYISFVETHEELQIIFVQEKGDPGYTVWLKEYPGIVAEGNSKEEAIKNVLTMYKDVKKII